MISPKYKLTGNLKSSQELHGNLNATTSTTVDLTNYYNKDEANKLLEEKQDKLIAGDNIKIENNIISAEASGGGSVDLTDYYKKGEVDAKLEEKQDSGPIFFIDIPSQRLNDADRYERFTLPSDFNEKLTSSLQKTLGKYNTFGVQFFITSILTTFYPSVDTTSTPRLKNKPSQITLYGEIRSNRYLVDSGTDTPTYTAPIPLTLGLTLSWSGDVPTVTAGKYGMYTYSKAIPSLDWVRSNTLTRSNTSPYTPTNDYHPATKKYVDNLLKSYTGYDASKTQVLKNVNGTLTWIDE